MRGMTVMKSGCKKLVRMFRVWVLGVIFVWGMVWLCGCGEAFTKGDDKLGKQEIFSEQENEESEVVSLTELQEKLHVVSREKSENRMEATQECPMETSVHKIRITKGTTGEVLELSREAQEEEFWEILEKYEVLDVIRSENQTKETGYSYWLRLYDEEDKKLASVMPRGHYVDIDGVRYESYENTSTLELMLAVDKCWAETFPRAELLETERQELETIEGFTMEITYATPRGASLQLTNSSDLCIHFGDSYSLQVYQDDRWYEIGYIIENWAFNAIGYELMPDTTRSLAVKWAGFHGELEPGTYRIVKDISDFRGSGDFTKYYIGAEFTLE